MVDSDAKKQLEEVIRSARRMNVELDEAEALAWLEAIQSKDAGSDIVMDERTGVFGKNVAMLDFSPERLEYFRTIGGLVEFSDIPGRVETALALSGSSPNRRSSATPVTAIILSESISSRRPGRRPARSLRRSCGKRRLASSRGRPTN